MLDHPIKVRDSTSKKERMQHSYTGESSSSAAPEVKNNNVVMVTVFDDAEAPVADITTAIFENALWKYCRIFQDLLQELPDPFEQCGCDVEMKINLVLTDHPHNVQRELGRQTSVYELFGENQIPELVDMCVDAKLVVMRTYSALWFNFRRWLRLFLPQLKASFSKARKETRRHKMRRSLNNRSKDRVTW